MNRIPRETPTATVDHQPIPERLERWKESQSPSSYANNLLSIYKGDAAAATKAVQSAWDANDPYWIAVLAALNDGRELPNG